MSHMLTLQPQLDFQATATSHASQRPRRSRPRRVLSVAPPAARSLPGAAQGYAVWLAASAPANTTQFAWATTGQLVSNATGPTFWATNAPKASNATQCLELYGPAPSVATPGNTLHWGTSNCSNMLYAVYEYAPVACPPGSEGVNVPTGCTCSANYTGNVTATSTSPYYVSTCALGKFVDATACVISMLIVK